MKATTMAILLVIITFSCVKNKASYTSFEEYPSRPDENLWLEYSKESTVFKIWSPTAEEVKVLFYKNGDGGKAIKTHILNSGKKGLWSLKVDGGIKGTYYTFQVKMEGKWLAETPGIYAQAVGVNGNRAMVLDFASTNPEDWKNDKGPPVKHPNEAIIYELHIRDMTIHPQSGSGFPGKYLGLVESGAKGPGNVTTGLDHLQELGITHVHLLPTYDHNAIDETRLESAQFNWGYDPKNYNVPEGSFSSDPYHAEVRITEFKQMVKTFHDHGIGVILDVVYNHTGRTENSNFNLEVPGYYYRQWDDGKLGDASACGNETASERTMMRKFIKESVSFWATEYHLDGFRFDLMGIHDIKTMNEITKTLKAINPNVIIYGEGWTAGDSPLPEGKRALKKHALQMPQLSVFSDDIRDGIKGSVFDNKSTGFVSGARGMEESIKFGLVGAIDHPQIDYTKVNYSTAPYTSNPWQVISYVSCHDNHTLYDKLKVSRSDADEYSIIGMDKLAAAIVFTSQGTAFMHAGAEMLRTKNGEHNSFNLPDKINQVDWNRKKEHKDVMDYYKNLIRLRLAHPALRMTSADQVRKLLNFETVEDRLISFIICDHANGDPWKNIVVIFNARTKSARYTLKGNWRRAVSGNEFNFEKGKLIRNKVIIPPISMFMAYQK